MKTRVVAYSRVSTDHEDQMNSLQNQKQHWEEFIKNNPNWEYAGMYWDEGITGTSAKKREGFLQMIEDAKAGKFDLIITKSVTRWARNIVDSIQYARELKKIGVAVYFASDNIHTIDDPDAELRLSIMSTLAQDESRRISENVKFGHLRAMKNGVVYGNDRVLGYDIKDKQLFINEEEAEIVRKIFDWFVNEGESLHGIIRRLKEEGFDKGKLGGNIYHSSIKRILQNEKYCGDLKQRKYYTVDFLEQSRKKNEGEVDFVIIRDHHEPIIERSLWEKAQEILNKRKEKYDKGIGYTRHCWGSKLICGVCGDKFRRKTLYNKTDGSERPIWICTTAHDKGRKGCENTSYIREDVLKDALNEVINQLKEKHNKEHLFNELNKLLIKITNDKDHKQELKKIEQQINKIQTKREKLLELYMDSNLTKENFNKINSSLNEEENLLRERYNLLTTRVNKIKEQINNLNDFYKLIVDKYNDINEIDKIVENYIIQVIKYKDRIVFELFTGDDVEVPMSKYPKRIINLDNKSITDDMKYPKKSNSRDYVSIMDIKHRYKVNRGAVHYYEEINIQVLLIA